MKSNQVITLLLMLLFFKSTNCDSQTYSLFGDKCFGGNGYEQNLRMINFNENLFVIGSSKSNPLTGNHTDSSCIFSSVPVDGDIWAVKFNSSFNILNDKSLGGNKEENDIDKIIRTSTNNIIFSCISNSDSSCDKSEFNVNFPLANNDFWICCIDSNGNKIWDKTLGGFGTESSSMVIELTDGNYVVAGLSTSGIGGDKSVANYGGYDFWVIKIDSIGNKIWDNVYGGSGQEFSNGFNGQGSSIIATENNSFVIMCSTSSPLSGSISQPSQGLSDIWIIKIDSVGNKIWDRRFGGNSNEYAGEIITTPDNGFMFVATTRSNISGDVSQAPIGIGNDVWVVKLDSSGLKQWDKRYGGVDFDIANSIKIAPDGGYWISAETNSPIGFDISDAGFGLTDYWIFKIDSAGNKLWDKRFGGPGEDHVSNFVIMNDSSIFLCGNADSGMTAVKTEFGYGASDYWVVHFKYGNISSSINYLNGQDNEISIFPNPAQESVNVNLNEKFGKHELLLYETSGKLLNQFNFSKSINIDVKDLPATIYIIEIVDSNQKKSYHKFLKF